MSKIASPRLALLSFVVTCAACGPPAAPPNASASEPAPTAPEVHAEPTASAPPPTGDATPAATATALPRGARVPCGATTCEPEEYCVETLMTGGAAPPPGTPPPTPTMSCSADLPRSTSGGFQCFADEDTRHVRCMALVPSAPPRR